jgi:ribosomal protein S27AE
MPFDWRQTAADIEEAQRERLAHWVDRRYCYHCNDVGLHAESEDMRLDLLLDGYYRSADEDDAGIPTLYHKCPRCGALPHLEDELIAMSPADVRAWLIEKRTAYVVLYPPLTHEAFKAAHWLASMRG